MCGGRVLRRPNTSILRDLPCTAVVRFAINLHRSGNEPTRRMIVEPVERAISDSSVLCVAVYVSEHAHPVTELRRCRTDNSVPAMQDLTLIQRQVEDG